MFYYYRIYNHTKMLKIIFLFNLGGGGADYTKKIKNFPRYTV